MNKMKIDIWITTDDGIDYHGDISEERNNKKF